jgi:hypothetical protein
LAACVPRWGMIMTDMLNDDDDDLERMFGAARMTAPQPSPDFAARILALAEAEQPLMARPAPVVPVTLMPTPVRRSGLADLLSLIGGWRAAGGLSTIMALGFVIGFAGPLQLSAASAATEQVDLMPGAEMLFADTSSAMEE